MSLLTSRFNLIDEPWIPVRWLNGSRAELGVRDTLLRAKCIGVIEDPSPLVVASLHRFLLAVLYRALKGPTDIDQAKGWFKAGLPADKIKEYLENWRERFWLFDEKHPFDQIPDFEPKIWRAWTALAAEHNADNAKVLFDHIDVTRPDPVSPGMVARWLLATQTFSVSAGKSELLHTGTAPSATAVMALPLGQNLEDTLLLSLVPQNRAVLERDLPVWERNADSLASLKAGVERAISGYADLYTWRTRSIRLRSNEDGNVVSLAFASGVKSTSKDFIDPMLAYRISKKGGRLPVQFEERGLWRDFDSLLPDVSSHKSDAPQAPLVIQNATELGRFTHERFPQSVMVLGQASKDAKIEYWRMERFALPQALLSDRSIRAEIRQLLGDAEDTQKALRDACCTFTRDLLSRGKREPNANDVGKIVEHKIIEQIVERMSASTSYWSRLEVKFHDILRDYTLERDTNVIRLSWLKALREALRDAWGQHVASVSVGDAWAIRALVQAEGAICKKLKRLNDEIRKYEAHHNLQGKTT